MTDVAGPPLPPARFSSLPIRGADAARTEGADEPDLEGNCSMAPAFEIPTGNRKTTRRCSPAGAIQEFPDALSRSPLPAGPTPSTGPITMEYGASFGLPQARANIGQTRPRGPADSGHGDLRRLINPVGFDKTKLPADSGFNGGSARSTGSTGSANFQPLYTASGDYSRQLNRNVVFENFASREHKKKPGRNGRAFL